MASFFIHRPVFAWVLAFVAMLVGAFSVTSLPISQYPDIAPTTVRISASYTGASAETVENSVTTVIEDGLTGLDGLTYMTSSSTEGSASVSLTFDDSIDPDMAQVQVQNKLQLVESKLPDTVTNSGVSVTRSTSSILLVGALVIFHPRVGRHPEQHDRRCGAAHRRGRVDQLFRQRICDAHLARSGAALSISTDGR